MKVKLLLASCMLILFAVQSGKKSLVSQQTQERTLTVSSKNEGASACMAVLTGGTSPIIGNISSILIKTA
jgi:hypothetical protein